MKGMKRAIHMERRDLLRRGQHSIKLVNATENHSISFRQIHATDGGSLGVTVVAR